MKSSIKPYLISGLVAVVLLLQTHPAFSAGDEVVFHYEGKITGLFCHACSNKVKTSLSRLKGVSQVRITKSEVAGVQRILLASSRDTLTKEQAIAALGDDAEMFILLEFQRQTVKQDESE